MSAAGDAAVFARLRSDSRLTNAVFEGTVLNPPPNYVSVFAPLGADSSDRLAGPSNVNDTTYTIHSVGLTVDGARSTARRVAALLTDYSIPGVGSITHPVSLPPQVDRDANPPLWYFVDQFDLTHS